MVVVLATFMLAGCGSKGPTSETGIKQTDNWLVVPIFFVTNRKPVPDRSQVDYLEEPNDGGVLVGVKNVIIPVPHDVDVSDDTCKKMGWRRVRTQKALTIAEAPPLPAAVPVATRHMDRKEMVPAFDAYRKESGTAEVLFFVHGCCVTFDKSLERAAVLATHMRCPVVLYNWVSPTGFRRYLENETRLEQTLDGFYELLTEVETMVPAGQITLVGHSMGARFLDVALVRRFDRLQCTGGGSKFNEVVMSNADVDARSFLNHNGQFTSNCKRTRIYFSTDDDRLMGSAVAHGGFERLGEPGGYLAGLCRNRSQDLIDITGLGTGHNFPYTVVAAMHHNDRLADNDEYTCERREPNLYVLKAVKGAAAH